MSKKLITILTTTYNRTALLPNLYNSLLNQSSQNFHWLVIDDGSTDDTYDLINKWKQESRISIEYYYHSNRGKMLSHNLGINKCKTECVMCVDSDDYLVYNAIEVLDNEWQKIREKECIGGIVCYRQMLDSNDNKLRHNNFKKLGIVNLSKLLYETKIETGLLFRTKIIKEFPFQPLDNEKFISEEVSYNLISDKYLFYTLPHDIIICKYHHDGYTLNYYRLLLQNPKGFSSTFNERVKRFPQFNGRLLMSIIRYIACCKIQGISIKKTIGNSNGKLLCLITYPVGIAYYNLIRLRQV